MKTKIVYLYLAVSLLMIANVCLFTLAKMSFVGYWSDRILFWFWLLLTLYILAIYWRKMAVKIYGLLLFLGLFLSILPMGLIFFGILLSVTGKGRLAKFSLADKTRVQVVNYGLIGRAKIQIVKDGFLFDKIIYDAPLDEIQKKDSTWLDIQQAKNCQLINQSDTAITLRYFFEKDTIQQTYTLHENTANKH